MSKMYLILTVVGWVWCLVVALFLVIRLNVSSNLRRRFDIVEAPTDVRRDAARPGQDTP